MIKLKPAALGNVGRKPGFIDEILKSGIFKAPFFRPGFLDKANKYLAVLLSFLLIYLLADTISFRPSAAVKKMVSGLSSRKTGISYTAGAPQQEETGYSHYGSILSGKQVFGKSIPAAGENESEAPVEITLVGIIMGARPQAIIENKNSKMFYRVYEGDRFENFTVEEVSADKVVVSGAGRRIELVL